MGDEISDHATSASHAGAVWLVAALCLAVLTCQLNATMVGPVLPDVARGLGVSIGAASWVQSLFFLAGAVAAILLGRLSDLHGGRGILLGVLAAQVAGAAL
ncbi:MFS transporter, partial [Endobacter medicaginis]